MLAPVITTGKELAAVSRDLQDYQHGPGNPGKVSSSRGCLKPSTAQVVESVNRGDPEVLFSSNCIRPNAGGERSKITKKIKGYQQRQRREYYAEV